MCADIHRGMVWVKAWRWLDPSCCGKAVNMKIFSGWDGASGQENALDLCCGNGVVRQMYDVWVRVESWGVEEVDALDGNPSQAH